MQINSGSQVFRSKQATKNLLLLFLDRKMIGERSGLCFWRLNNGEKRMTNVLSRKKESSNLCMVYFEFTLEQIRCARCI